VATDIVDGLRLAVELESLEAGEKRIGSSEVRKCSARQSRLT
jgi:hypothetical protein